MKLSVVVPVYQVAATLQRCVTSILAQTFTNLEVILVDDGSTDQGPALCDAWAQADDRVTVVHQPNGGLSAARNTGIARATSEYITFVDSDDYLEPHTYAQVMPLATDNDMVEFPFSRHHATKHQQLVSFPEKQYDRMEHYWLQAEAYRHSYMCNKIFRRELFAQVQFPVGRVFEDMAVLPLLLAQCRRVATTGRGLYYYCDNPQGITLNAGGAQLQMLLEAHLAVLPRWADDRYYLHVLNIQIDVFQATRQRPLLKRRYVNPLQRQLPLSVRLKALVANVCGIECLCRICNLLNRTKVRRS